MKRRYKLPVGKGRKLIVRDYEPPTKIFGESTRELVVEVLYAGMPNKETFTVSSPMRWSYQTLGFVNVFYPTDIGEIEIQLSGYTDFFKFTVKNVTPHYLELEYIAKNPDKKEEEGRVSIAEAKKEEGNLSLEDLTE